MLPEVILQRQTKIEVNLLSKLRATQSPMEHDNSIWESRIFRSFYRAPRFIGRFGLVACSNTK